MIDFFGGEVYTYELEMLVSKALHCLGIPAHIKGNRYLREAIIMAINDPKATDLITKGLYPGIAKKYGTTPSKVNAAICHAIDVSWKHSPQSPLDTLIFSERKSKPKNSEYISELASYIKATGSKGPMIFDNF